MKMYMLLLGFVLCSLTGMAQETAMAFQNDYETAKELATKEDKAILMVFSGSDWCRPCMKFKKKVLDNATFQSYSHENIVVLYLDFPQRRRNRLSKEQTAHNEALAEQYNPSGEFPKAILFNRKGEAIKEMKTWKKSGEDFVNDVKAVLK